MTHSRARAAVVLMPAEARWTLSWLATCLATCLVLVGCGGSRDTALSSAGDSVTGEARSAKGVFAAELSARRGETFEQAQPSLRKVLVENSSAAARAVVAESLTDGQWRTVVLYEAQRPYTRGFTSDELRVAGCVEYRVSVDPLELLSAGPIECPAEAADRFDATVRVDLEQSLQ